MCLFFWGGWGWGSYIEVYLRKTHIKIVSSRLFINQRKKKEKNLFNSFCPLSLGLFSSKKCNFNGLPTCFDLDLILKEWKTREITVVVCLISENSQLGYTKSTYYSVSCRRIDSKSISLLSQGKLMDTYTKVHAKISRLPNNSIINETDAEIW